MVLSLAALFRATLWTAFYAVPLAVDYASDGVLTRTLPSFAGMDWVNQAAQTAGTTGVLLYSVVLALFLTAAAYHLRVPPGGVAVLVLWDGLLTAATTGMWLYVPAIVVGAATGECWLAYARQHYHSSAEPPELTYWVLAASVPVALFTTYFGIMASIAGGIAWPPHLWTGTIASAGLFAAIASVLSVPPRWARR
jgi:hypothetical protein